jgi:hypothetical protein
VNSRVFDRSKRNGVKACGQPELGEACGRAAVILPLPRFFVSVASKGFSSSVDGAKLVPVWRAEWTSGLCSGGSPGTAGRAAVLLPLPCFFVSVASKGFSSPVAGGQISVRGCEHVLIPNELLAVGRQNAGRCRMLVSVASTRVRGSTSETQKRGRVR